MSTKEPLIYPMPNGYELGMFVQQIAEQDEPRAIILDFLQRTILVHPPSEDGMDQTDFTADSLAFLLTSIELEHTDMSLDECVSKLAGKNTKLWVCAHPDVKQELSYDGDVLWTKIVEPNYLLLVTRSSDQSQEWKVLGMTRDKVTQDT